MEQTTINKNELAKLLGRQAMIDDKYIGMIIATCYKMDCPKNCIYLGSKDPNYYFHSSYEMTKFNTIKNYKSYKYIMNVKLDDTYNIKLL